MIRPSVGYANVIFSVSRPFQLQIVIEIPLWRFEVYEHVSFGLWTMLVSQICDFYCRVDRCLIEFFAIGWYCMPVIQRLAHRIVGADRDFVMLWEFDDLDCIPCLSSYQRRIEVIPNVVLDFLMHSEDVLIDCSGNYILNSLNCSPRCWWSRGCVSWNHLTECWIRIRSVPHCLEWLL